MKFSTSAVMALLLAEQTSAFAPSSPIKTNNYRTQSSSPKTSSSLSMAIDIDVGDVAAPAVANAAIVQKAPDMIVKNPGGGPSDVRYSEFLRLVDGDKIEKVTFSSDGTQLLGVDVDGTRLKIESLPNDPDLLTQLTSHKVRIHTELIDRLIYQHFLFSFQFPFLHHLTLLYCHIRFSLSSSYIYTHIFIYIYRLMLLYYHNKNHLD